MFVTPSRLDRQLREEIAALSSAAATALGLVVGPIHAEARVSDGQVSVLEVAARSIGGLCGRALSFGLLGTSLETMLLRSALGYRGPAARPASPASGVMMLPIARAGTLAAVGGIEQAKAVPGITDIEITIPLDSQVRPLPEADRYLGFMFANGTTPLAVEPTRLFDALTTPTIPVVPFPHVTAPTFTAVPSQTGLLTT